MGQLYIPSLSEIMAVSHSRGADSDAPYLWKGLVGAWPLQEGAGATAFDVSGYSNHGTLTNMAPATDWVVTEKGRALTFTDAAAEHVATTCDMGAAGALDTFSLVALVRRTRSNHVEMIFADTWGGVGNGFLFLYETTYLRCIARIGGTWAGTSNGGMGAHTNWQHVAVTYNGAKVTVWHDAAVAGTRSASGALYNSSSPIRIGAETTGANVFDGQIVCPSIHSRALLPSEIQQLYSDPWAMYRLRARVFPAAAVGGGIPRWFLDTQMAGGLAG